MSTILKKLNESFDLDCLQLWLPWKRADEEDDNDDKQNQFLDSATVSKCRRVIGGSLLALNHGINSFPSGFDAPAKKCPVHSTLDVIEHVYTAVFGLVPSVLHVKLPMLCYDS